jgi:hypothetical protein
MKPKSAEESSASLRFVPAIVPVSYVARVMRSDSADGARYRTPRKNE